MRDSYFSARAKVRHQASADQVNGQTNRSGPPDAVGCGLCLGLADRTGRSRLGRWVRVPQFDSKSKPSRAKALLFAIATLGGAAHAQELRPAPAYVSDMFAHVYAAETLAQWCPSVSVDSKQVQEAWVKVFARLDAEGFDVEREDAGMRDPSQEIGEAVEAWANKRNLSEASEISQVCRAAEAEMAEKTQIGRFLERNAG